MCWFDVLVDGFHIGGAVVTYGFGAAGNELVETADFDVALAVKHDEIVDAVVGCARLKLHHLVFEVLSLFNIGVPPHHYLRLVVGNAMDAEEVGSYLVDDGEVCGERIIHVEGE